MHVMRVLTRPNVGGPTAQAVALWHAHRALGAGTLLVVGRCGPGETAIDLEAAGVPRLADTVDFASPGTAAGFIELPELGNQALLRGSSTARRRLEALMQRARPDVVHTHTSKAGWLGRRAALAAGVPVLAHTFHGHVLRGYFGPLRSFVLARMEAHLARRTDLLFAVSPSCAEELAALGVARADRLQVLPPAVALVPAMDRMAARAELGVGEHDWLVACIGRLVPIKRVDRFVAAVAQLPGCRGHVYGDGPLRDGLAAKAPADGRIAFRGSDPAVRARLSAYDALVLPSAREGCPLVAIEAFAAGVPVVGFDVPGVRDALGPWGGGVLVPEAAGAMGLCAALERLRADADLRARCIAAGRRGLDRFSPESVARQLLLAYGAARDARVGYAGRRRS